MRFSAALNPLSELVQTRRILHDASRHAISGLILPIPAGKRDAEPVCKFFMAARNQKSLEQRLLDLLGSARYQPGNKTDLARRLRVSVDQRAAFRRLLGDLENQGKITRIRKDRYVLPQEADLVVGALQVNPQGFGYVVSESGNGRGDLYIAAENLSTAMHRDQVVARIIRDRVLVPKGSRHRATREGRVIKILKRANETIVGTLQRSKNFHYVVPDEPALVHDIYVTLKPGALPRTPEIDDKVVVKLEPWEHRHVNPEGEIIEVLGPSSKPGIDILSIIRKFHLPVDFPDGVLQEADRISTELLETDFRGREDLRSMPVFTIDPENARDFDDAIHVEKSGNGWTLGVHIADVSHYVKAGSALDREAFQRGNSVYLPDRVLPMLPERLSNGVCSLHPNADRLTKSVFVEFGPAGTVRSYRFAATVIRSSRRLTYRQASFVLQKKPADPIENHLHRAWELASMLRKRRFKQGALELDMPEVRVRLDEQGRVIALEREENDASHQLIEEFMLVANEVVGRETKRRRIPSIYRVHEDPDPQRLIEFREQARFLGFEIGDLSQRREMQRFLKSLVGKPEEGALKLGLLRSLRKAVYSPDPLGHYGLSKSNYTHFTSPIRRYADLVVHRAFGRLLAKHKERIPRSIDLASISEHISTTERIAADAEREAVRLKKMEYFAGLIRKPHRLQGSVIEVRNYGLVVELKEELAAGLIHVSSMDTDFFTFDPGGHRLIGRRTRESFGVGDRVTVRVSRVDPFKQQIDFVLVSKE
jgi:ribonuclease R